ncbi:MAG: DUF721 domain-containing protein [Rectinemataceae bacterium]|jgi:hypothetical protein
MDDSRIKDISSLLSSFFDVDKQSRGEQVSSFFDSWSSFVGPRLAAHSRVSDVDKGLLVVEADHPGWIQLLQLRQSDILENVARRYPELKLRGIIFRLAGPAALIQTEPPVRAEETDPTPETEIEKVTRAHALDDIADPEFRALLSSLKKTMQGKD